MAKKTASETSSFKWSLGCNKYIVETDMCDAFAVASIEMPKMLFTKAGPKSDEQRIKEKSNLVVCLHWITEPDQTSKVIAAATNGIKKFKIRFLTDAGKVILEWIFTGTKIQAVDFGELAYEQNGSEEHPFGLIKIEMEYESIEIAVPKVK
jgi:hypothetical protein